MAGRRLPLTNAYAPRPFDLVFSGSNQLLRLLVSLSDQQLRLEVKIL